jgi:tryptophanyl-tRNA synthetase
MNKNNLVSGMRPTGQLHFGHYLGVIRNWVELQNADKYNCFFFVADWHSLTTKYTDTSELQQNIIEVAKDFLACGLDENKSIIYVQSAIPEIAELHLLLSMITPNNWAERDPTLKDLVRAAAGGKEEGEAGVSLSYGMLGYPILQTSDILTLKGSLVPIGKDQEAHLELSREIARRFNYIFGTEFFPEPKPVFTDTPLVLGVDGGKMSKSFNNDLKIAATPEETIARVKQMITDAQRLKKTDPGNTERCLVPFPFYKIIGNEEVIASVKEECETAARGCVQCKMQLAELINNFLQPIREKRNSLDEEKVKLILKEGNQRARSQAKQVLSEVRKIMNLNNWI